MGGTTVGAVHGEGGARRDASCKVRRAWTSFCRAAISARSSAITLGDLEGMGATGRVGARGPGEGGVYSPWGKHAGHASASACYFGRF